MANEFHFSTHPLVAHKLSQLRRSKDFTKSKEYVRLMRELGMLMAYEATQGLPIVKYERVTESKYHKDLPELVRKPIIVPIIRSGLPLFEGVREVIATSYIGHIGIHNEKNRKDAEGPLTYFAAMPDDLTGRHVFIVDPMMVSGATAAQAVNVLKEIYSVDEGRIIFITLVVTSQAKHLLSASFKNVKIYAAAFDNESEDIDIINDFDTMSTRMYRSS